MIFNVNKTFFLIAFTCWTLRSFNSNNHLAIVDAAQSPQHMTPRLCFLDTPVNVGDQKEKGIKASVIIISFESGMGRSD